MLSLRMSQDPAETAKKILKGATFVWGVSQACNGASLSSASAVKSAVSSIRAGWYAVGRILASCLVKLFWEPGWLLSELDW